MPFLVVVYENSYEFLSKLRVRKCSKVYVGEGTGIENLESRVLRHLI